LRIFNRNLLLVFYICIVHSLPQTHILSSTKPKLEVEMSKKILIGGLVALALTAIIATAALAAPSQADPTDPPNPPGPRGGPGHGPLWEPPHLSGEITAVGTDQFTLTTEGNQAVTVEVTEFTSYLGSLDSFADLEIGLDVAVAGRRSDEGTVEARVVVTRDDLPIGTPMGGEVTAVGSDSLTIENTRGGTFRFDVTADTDFLSRENNVTSLSEIEVGDHVMVLFEQASGGTLSANVILVGGPVPEGNN
jgi:hypothetical protein